MKVVIVEDEEFVAHALRRTLAGLGCKVVVVLEPLEIEAVLEHEQPDLLVCDMRMPTRSGLDVLAIAREKFPHIKRCLLSGSLSALKDIDVGRIEPCVVLNKPWKQGELETLVASSRPA